ncbi:MAG: SpoIIE family protein phosphatase, partial [Gammaproteobacteria bacterium]|nr:SpoIIE family protein phosphatase [Gammaproteobacteria bacterium]
IIFLFDKFLQGTRGAVIGICLIDIKSGLVNYISIGNIRTRIIGQQGYRFIARTGVLGFTKTKPILEKYLLNNKDILLMYSDGITDRFEIKDYPNIITDPVEVIAANIMQLFSKKMDDASCIAVRYLYD